MLVKVPLSWLQDYCDIPWSAQELADRLTMSLLEVDEILTMGIDYDKMVVGEVLTAEKHPNADRLKLCTVDVGSDHLDIVCGAPNVEKGQRVAIAMIGAIVAGDLRIKRSKIRGIVSYGMICSEAELNLSPEADGIMVLDSDIPIGSPLKDVLGSAETVLSVDVGTNRPDCLAFTGVAREVAALTGKSSALPSGSLEETGAPIETLATVAVEDHADCVRFVGRVISNVQIGPSPLWMSRRLAAAGIRAINNVVDVTNYVMLEMGQPLHAYDLDTLAGNEINVRRAEQDVPFTTLDGTDRKLTPEMLMIADRDQNIGLAGVMGGLNTEITEGTTRVFLEGACFDAVRVRRSAKLAGLSTDASQRFERGMDPELQSYAVDRAAQLIAELGNGSIATGRIDVRKTSEPTPTVILRPDRVNALLGTNILRQDMIIALETLGFVVRATEALEVEVPSFRRDVSREADLIEEIARLYGYDRLEPVMSQPHPPDFRKPDVAREQRHLRQRRFDKVTSGLRGSLAGVGFSEVLTHSFASPEDLRIVDGSRSFVEVDNPISREYAVMRTSLAANILNLIRWNANRKARNIRVFEIGKVFEPSESGPLPVESLQMCAAMTGNRAPPHWGNTEQALDFFDIKGIVESSLEAFPLDKVNLVPYDESHHFLAPDVAATGLIGGQKIVSYGLVCQEVLKHFEINEPVWLYVLNCEVLLGSEEAGRSYHALPKFPAVERDLAIVVSEDVNHQEISDILWDTCGSLLESVELFDVYKGKQVPSGKKSLAYALR
ncbi:MAG: phenylalanine--tRNA ligase subunit beta, partial [Candidatus Latescibacteria bacterium]|nr:phenylalanine--tRNA ligase subunit beta [Candidatus Latescibacterota bacterium]